MTLDFDPADDLAQVADGIETVTVTRPGTSTATVVSGALRSLVRASDAARSAGRFTATDAAWHLPTSELTEAPRAGDVIVDSDDARWTVLAVGATTLRGRWRCVARNLAVEHGLDAYVDIERATLTKGTDGAETVAWHTWKTGLAAKIQPVAGEPVDEHDRRVTRSTAKIYLAQDLELDRTHRVRGPDGTVYRVQSYRKADRVDALMEIDAVQSD